jgi:CubicO group peptidase (beta-lactamase class C family)
MERFSAQQLAEWAAEARERWSVPGIAVGVFHEGETVAVADGVCAVGGDEQVSPETQFRIASITKPFTATLAMTLAEDGLLALDEPPPGSQVEATTRQLLSNQGGLACEWPSALEELGSGEDGLQRVAGGDPPRLPVGPGELFSYCNVGFWLVGAGAARACGMTFQEALRDRVLEPLDLAVTEFEPQHATLGHEQTEPGSDEHVVVDHPYPRTRTPSGGLWSTVDDLLRFAGHHLGGAGPLSRESVQEMQQPHIPAPGGSYGLGWFLRESAGRRIVEHLGSAAGFESLLLLVPDESFGFAALTNSSRGSAAIRELVERLDLGSTGLPDHELSPERLAAFGGAYSGNGLEIEVVPERGRLSVAVTVFDPFSGEHVPYPPVLARPVAEREFEVVDAELRGERLTFPRDGFVCMGVLVARTE